MDITELLGKTIEFSIDDISDDVFVDNIEVSYSEYETIVNLFEELRKNDWFLEGNKTEGTMKFTEDKKFELTWRTINMDFNDLDDDDVSDDYVKTCVIIDDKIETI